MTFIQAIILVLSIASLIGNIYVFVSCFRLRKEQDVIMAEIEKRSAAIRQSIRERKSFLVK